MNKRFSEFVSYLSSLRSVTDMEDFLMGILTSKERTELPIRLQIVKMLKARIPQHTIAHKLKVGIATVTRGSKELQLGRFTQVPPAKWR